MDLNGFLIRLLITFLLSLFYGVQRQLSHKPIGFGTFTFVATGSCALAITAMRMNPANPLPLLGAIVTGIGFLGAGALIKTGDKVAGFTSAALIWIFAVFGLTMGSGDFWVAGIVYILIWAVTIYDRSLERRGVGSYFRKIVITTKSPVSTDTIRKTVFGGRKHTLLDLRVDKTTGSITATFSVEGTHVHIGALSALLEQQDWCASYTIE